MPQKNYEQILPRVQTPGQYAGGEVNSVIKPDAPFRLALCFPDTYAIGMSNHGLRVLYEIANALPDWAAERAYCPLPDMEGELRASGVPLLTLETGRSLAVCDVVSFSMQYELCGGGMLTMLDLCGIGLTRFTRAEDAPLIIGGGHALFNPEPFSDFFDFMFIGEGEEGLPQILNIVAQAKGKLSRRAMIEKIAAEVTGVYAPSLYDTEECGGLTIVKKGSAPYPVRRAVIADFAACLSVIKPVVPVVETIHERVVLELMRGCPNGCRFCQAGMVCRPQRERGVEELFAAAKTCYRNTGYEEIGLLSLSTSDYSRFDELVEKLDSEFAPRGVSLSLPSLRVDHALSGIPKRFKSVRKSGLTIAPEAGTDRLRRVINKDVTRENLLQSAQEAFSQGWKNLKLYFMLGLPTETDEDVAAIAELSNEVSRLAGRGGRGPAVTCSVSNFIPKPCTPFQWEAMALPQELTRKQHIIADKIWHKTVSYKGHDSRLSFLEGVLARGDRKLGRVILRAWQDGARLEAWTDYFNFDTWEKAFAAENIVPADYLGARALDAPQPWSHIDAGISEEFLRRECEKSRHEIMTARCSKDHCGGCGVAGCSYKL